MVGTTKTRPELERELAEQLQLLRLDCINFDRGVDASGKRIALSLRLLFNEGPRNQKDNRPRSRSLMGLLGLNSGLFLSSVPSISHGHLLSESPLLVMQLSKSSAQYLPLVSIGGGPFEMTCLKFDDWWLQPIIKDTKGGILSRMCLVRYVSNKDGGAHVDETLPTNYAALTRENSLGWIHQFGEIGTPLTGRPELACMRQIAHETLCSIERFVPEFAQHAQPVLPEINHRFGEA